MEFLFWVGLVQEIITRNKWICGTRPALRLSGILRNLIIIRAFALAFIFSL